MDQFRREFGIIEKVSDRSYVTNSFHCHVTEDITPIEKQDSENRFWGLLNGGKIQYCRYNTAYNLEAIKTLVRRAMKLGLYEGVNLELSYCGCGYQVADSEYKEHMVCPQCGKTDQWTKITRMNGYLAFSRAKGSSRLNAAKMQEVADRISM